MREAPPVLLLAPAALCLLSVLYVRWQFSLGNWSRLPGAASRGAPAGAAPAEDGHLPGPGARGAPLETAVRPQNTAASAAAGAALDLAPPKAVALDPSKVQWLHIPKCGTSFIYVLVAWACPTAKQPNCDMSVGTVGPVCPALRHLNCAGHWAMGSEVFQKGQGRFVSVFRRPEQRLISHYWMRGARLKQPWPEFIRDVGSCQAKALIGRGCIAPYELTDPEIEEAVRRIEVGFAFVGIMEEWAQMVCLFHRMLGGSCRADEAMHFRESKPRRKGETDSEGNYNVSALNGYIDKADTRVYEAAKAVFHNNVRRYGGTPPPPGCGAFCS